MATLNKDARRGFWSRPGTFGIVGAFEGPNKLGWVLLSQCQQDGIGAVPVNPDLKEVLGVPAVADPAEISSLAGIVCVRLDPYATSAVEKAESYASRSGCRFEPRATKRERQRIVLEPTSSRTLAL